MVLARIVEDVFRTDGRRVLAGLIRLTGDFDAAEDALQEACARALDAWPRSGVPAQPGAWINTVARRVAIDRLRVAFRTEGSSDFDGPGPVDDAVEAAAIEDDRLRLLFVCCHPALPFDSRAALALRTLGGLTTREIARAFIEPESTTAQRIVRAKRKIRETRIPFAVPPLEKLPERTDAVLAVLYLIFNEGYTSTDAPSLIRPDRVREAIRLTRLAVELLPASAEAQGLLALMLLTDARRAARMDRSGELVPLEEQDRSLWDRALIDEGTMLVDAALLRGEPGPYQTQAAIAALHDAAAAAAETDWRQIALLYRTLLRWTPTPIVELNAAIALGMATRVDEALDWIARIEAGGALASYHHLHAAKADLLRRSGRFAQAIAAYRDALGLVTNPAERRFLEARLTELSVAASAPHDSGLKT